MFAGKVKRFTGSRDCKDADGNLLVLLSTERAIKNARASRG